MKADYLLKSRAVFTGIEDQPFPGGIAVRGNRIQAVLRGKEAEDNPAEQVIDVGEKLIMPAFVDAHVHYFIGAISSSEYMTTEIAASTSEKECVEMVRRYAGMHPDHKRILGIGWFPATWKDAPLPTKESLDLAVPDRPVYLIAADCHTFWMNSQALAESGITPDMKPRSGKVGVDENGELNGLLFEPDAFSPAMNKVQEFDTETMIRINRDFIRQATECGVTSISEMSADPYDEAVYQKYNSIRQMDKQGLLQARLHVYTELMGHTHFETAKKWNQEFHSDKFRVAGVKGFVDGVTSTYTGLLLEPYADRPDTCGIDVPPVPEKEFAKYVVAANREGLQVRLHCLGDGAVRMALDLYEQSVQRNGHHGLPNTIEHIENIHPDDIPRFVQLGVIPSMQPYHLTLDGMEKPRRIGKERCRWEWPHRSLLSAGAKLAFGTDYPVVDFNPYPSIYAAITRLTDDGKPASINPEQCITLAEALRAYTAGAAGAYGRTDIGTLAPGNLADIIVVNQNLFALEPKEILHCQTDLTMFDGKIVFER